MSANPVGRPPGITTAPVSTRLPMGVAARLLRLRLDHGYTVAEVVRAGVVAIERRDVSLSEEDIEEIWRALYLEPKLQAKMHALMLSLRVSP